MKECFCVELKAVDPISMRFETGKNHIIERITIGAIQKVHHKSSLLGVRQSVISKNV